MKPEIRNDFLRRLIDVRETHDFSLLPAVFAEYPPHSVGQFMRKPPDWWYAVADSLTENELEALIRVMTVAERDYPPFGGGSVTGAIWAFRRLQQRTRNSLDGLADWILAHTTNPWVPFGSNNHGARSLTDLRTLRERAASMRSEKALKENERQAADAVRIADKATRDIFAAIRRKDIKAVQALLIRGARLDIADPTGNTALTYARSLGYLPVIELLEAQATQIPPNV